MYSVQGWQREQLLRDARADPEILAPGQYQTPYPGVADIYVVLDFARAPEARRASSAFTLDPTVVAGSRAEFATAGGGQCFQFMLNGYAWIPTVSSAAVWGEYWLVARGLGGRYSNFERNLPATLQFSVAETASFGASGRTRARLVPMGAQTLARPTTLDLMQFSLATPCGPVTFPQMVFPATVSYSGTAAVLEVGAHDVPVGDVIVATSGLLQEDNPSGCAVTAVAGTSLEVASSRPAGLTERIEVIIGSRWIRLPAHFRSLVSRTTNFTAP